MNVMVLVFLLFTKRKRDEDEKLLRRQIHNKRHKIKLKQSNNNNNRQMGKKGKYLPNALPSTKRKYETNNMNSLKQWRLQPTKLAYVHNFNIASSLFKI